MKKLKSIKGRLLKILPFACFATGIILLMCLLVPTFSYEKYSNSLASMAGMQRISRAIKSNNGNASGSASADRKDVTAIPLPDLTELQKRNEDIRGWIYIPDTAIDNPILVNSKDYYLYRGADRQHDKYGSIFSRKPLSDDPVILYGHNMRDGAMFGGIKRYKDAGYMKKHKLIYVYHDNSWHIYTAKAVVTTDDEGLENLYQEDRKSLLSRFVKVPEEYYGKKLIFLSTCGGKGIRVILMGVEEY